MGLVERIYSILEKIISVICRILPLKNQIVFESVPDFSDNTYFLYKKMIEKGYNNKYHMIWLLHKPYDGTPLPENVHTVEFSNSLIKGLRFFWITSRSKFIFDCNRYVYKNDSRQKRIHLKHGLPIKDASFYTKQIGGIDVLCVPSEYWIDISSKEHNVNKKYIKPLGFPRNDALVVKEHQGINIMWMPTYIAHTKGYKDEIADRIMEKMPFGFPCIESKAELQKLDEILRSGNAHLYIRLHPAQKTIDIPLDNLTNITLCNDAFLSNNNTTLYSFLGLTDALISDYSSIYYDYLNLDKPIALVTKFFKEYREDLKYMSFTYGKFIEKFPSTFINSFDELISFVNEIMQGNDPGKKERQIAIEKYMPKSSKCSAERIIDYITENYNF